MKFFTMFGAAAFAGLAVAEDLLFLQDVTGDEITHAQSLGYTTKTVTKTEWQAMTSADFAKYKAIVMGDPYCLSSDTGVSVLVDTKDIWGPAVTGNIIVIGMKSPQLS
jgi:hypothetical protein